jgi:hypothetical protein
MATKAPVIQPLSQVANTLALINSELNRVFGNKALPEHAIALLPYYLKQAKTKVPSRGRTKPLAP